MNDVATTPPSNAAIDWREVRSRYPAVTSSTFLNITKPSTACASDDALLLLP